jgi:subtilisin-like proprotein convertase family protein
VATQQCFDTSNTIGGLLASDLDGPTQPPAGSPNYLLALGTNQIAFFKMTVDFANSANSKFVGPTFIPTAAFASPCSGLPCVTQPGTTNKLDTLANRMMARLVYRRFSNHEALLVSHAVAAGTGSGIRFYELRNPTTTPTIFQQGTYAPDTAFRWAGSMAFDSAGDIGLGFSISSSTISPSIRYTGRLATDILGMISQGEATSINGTGAQTIGTGWAESSIDIDPTDDCTFWHMGKYIAGTGSFNWHTRIGSFKFNDFNITVNPGSRTAIAGSITTYIITTTAQCSPQNVALSVSDLPNGVTASFNPTNVTAGGQSTLTLRTSVTTGAGTTRFRITGTSLSATHSVSPSLTVTPNELPALTITSPGNGSTVDGFVTVSATASDTDGIASVQFDLPDGTSVFDTLAPFSATWDSTSVPEGSGYLIHATATDKQGAMSVATATMTVDNCLNNTFSSTGEPIEIPDNDFLGITSSISVTGNGTVASLVLSHDIAHPNVSELKATLLSPDDTSFTVPLGASSKIVEVSTFNGEAAAGTWQLSIVDNRLGDEGKLNSWSLTIVGICPQITHWSSTATPNLPTIDNGMACTSLTVTTEASSLGAKLDIFGRHDFRSILRGTLAHDGAPVAAFPTGTFPSGSGIFSFTNRAVPGLSGDASGTWTLCIIDTDAFGDTGVLTAWSVHD